MAALLNEVSRHRAADGGRTVIEYSAVGDSQSNGVTERATEGQLRVARSALESRVKAKIIPEHAVMTWLTEHGSMLLDKYEVSRGGKTAYEWSKGKQSRMMGLEFSESVMWRRKPIGKILAQLAVMWDEGVYLGVKGSTGEVIMGTADGVWRKRTMRRRPEEMRWNTDEIEQNNVGAVGQEEREGGGRHREAEGGHRQNARGDATGGERGRRGRNEYAEVVQHEARRLREAWIHEGVSGMSHTTHTHIETEAHDPMQQPDGE